MQIYCLLNRTQHITIIVQITGNKNEYTLSEHVKTVSKVSTFCRAPLLSSTALILLGLEFTRATHPAHCWHTLPLLHNDITELLDVRHMVLLHFPLEDAPDVLNMVQAWRHTWPLHHLQLHQQGSCYIGGVFGVVMMENRFWRGWGIIFCFRMSQYMLELMFPSVNRSSSVPAVVMQPQTMMLPPPCLTVGKIFLVILTRAWPHMLNTIWTKQVYLRLIRPQDMVPVIHALGQVVFSKFAGFFVSQLQKRLPSGTTAMQTYLLQCVVYGLSADELTFHFCNL